MGAALSSPSEASAFSGREAFSEASAVGCACANGPTEPPAPQVWLVFHLLLSFLLVAHVRWHHRPLQLQLQPGVDVETPTPVQDMETQTESTTDEAHADSESAATAAELPVASEPPVSKDASEAAAPDKPEPEPKREQEDERLAGLRKANAKYLSMLKVGMPRSVVEHKMRMEGADASVLDALLGASPASHKPMAAMMSSIVRPPPIIIPPPQPAEEITAIAQDLADKYASFKQMVKVGVPRHVVEHKMKSQGLDPAGLDNDRRRSLIKTVSEPASPRSVSSSVSTAPSSPDSSGSGGFLQLNRPPILARVVIRKMQTNMRKKLHWSTTSVSDAPPTSVRRDSVWNRVQVRAKANRVSISTETVQWMEKLFVKSTNPVKITNGKKARRRWNSATSNPEGLSANALAVCDVDDLPSDDEIEEEEPENTPEEESPKDPAAAFLTRKVYVTLLEGNKSQNIAIVLARIKKPFSQLVREISVLDQSALPISALQTLLDMWPDTNEQAALDSFNDDIAALATAEVFLLEAQKVPRVHQKLRCLRFKADFFSRTADIRTSMDLVIRGVSQVISSDAFAQVLEYIYHLGNLLNFGKDVEYTSKVKSISISSLAKLSFTKAYDGRVSFLQYLVQSIERDAPHLAHFIDEIDLITKCSKVSVSSVLADLSALKAGLRMVQTEAKQPLPVAMASLRMDDPVREAFVQSKLMLHNDVMTLGQEINALTDLSDQLDRQSKRFMDYFEEDAALQLDELLGFIATFVTEYSHERSQLVRRALERRNSTPVEHKKAYMPKVAKRHSL